MQSSLVTVHHHHRDPVHLTPFNNCHDQRRLRHVLHIKKIVHNWVNTVNTHHDGELCIGDKVHSGLMHEGWSFVVVETGLKSTADRNVKML